MNKLHIEFVDAAGNKYVLMITGRLVETLAGAVKAKRIETNKGADYD